MCACPSVWMQGSRQLSRAFSEPQERAKAGLGVGPPVEEGPWGALLDFEVKEEDGEGIGRDGEDGEEEDDEQFGIEDMFPRANTNAKGQWTPVSCSLPFTPVAGTADAARCVAWALSPSCSLALVPWQELQMPRTATCATASFCLPVPLHWLPALHCLPCAPVLPQRPQGAECCVTVH